LLKKTIYLILLCLCFSTTVTAETQKTLFDKGVTQFKQGQYQQAIESFSKLIEMAPQNADAFKNRGVSYMKQEKFDLAITDFERAKALFPELRGLYSNLGVAWYYKKNYEKAIENYDIEIEMAPENPVAYFNRALCLAELKRNEEALEDLSQTLKLKPDFYWALCYKADLLADAGKNIQAINAYEAAIQQDPENTYATQKLTRLRQITGPPEKTTTVPATEPAHPTAQETAQTKDPGPTRATNPATGYALQAGAFLGQTNAEKMKSTLTARGFDSRILTLKDAKDRTWYLVRSGHYPRVDEAKQAIFSLKNVIGVAPVVRKVGTW